MSYGGETAESPRRAHAALKAICEYCEMSLRDVAFGGEAACLPHSANPPGSVMLPLGFLHLVFAIYSTAN